MLLLAFHTSHVRSRAFKVGIVLVVVADLANLVQAATGHTGGNGSTFIMFVLVLLAPIAIIHRIIRHETVGLETILGSICVYVLIAISFAGIYGAINEAEPTGFFAQKIEPNNVDFLYFSFITITTVGYGDLSPGHQQRARDGDVRGGHGPDLPRDPGGAPREPLRQQAASGARRPPSWATRARTSIARAGAPRAASR